MRTPWTRESAGEGMDRGTQQLGVPVMGRLYVRDADGRPATYELARGVYRVGRDGSNAIRVMDTKASRHHCEIEVTEMGCILKDLESRNGTTVNGKSVREAWLKDGDEIGVGGWSLVFRDGSASSPQGVAPEASVELCHEDAMESSVNLTITSDQAAHLYRDVPEGQDSAKRTDILSMLYEVAKMGLSTSRSFRFA